MEKGEIAVFILFVLFLLALKFKDIRKHWAKTSEAPPELHSYLVKRIQQDHASLPMMRVRQLVDAMRRDAVKLNALDGFNQYQPYLEFRKELFGGIRADIIEKAASSEALWKKVAPKWKAPGRRKAFLANAADEVLGDVDDIAQAFWLKRHEFKPRS